MGMAGILGHAALFTKKKRIMKTIKNIIKRMNIVDWVFYPLCIIFLILCFVCCYAD